MATETPEYVVLTGEQVVNSITGLLLAVLMSLLGKQRLDILVRAAIEEDFNVRFVRYLAKFIEAHASGGEEPDLDEVIDGLVRLHEEGTAHA